LSSLGNLIFFVPSDSQILSAIQKVAPKPFDSWILNEESAQWEPPFEYPTDGKLYAWDEETTSWDEVPEADD